MDNSDNYSVGQVLSNKILDRCNNNLSYVCLIDAQVCGIWLNKYNKELLQLFWMMKRRPTQLE